MRLLQQSNQNGKYGDREEKMNKQQKKGTKQIVWIWFL